MTDPETLLSGLWAADEPPARDDAFVAAAMAKVARRRFQLALLALVPPALAVGAVVWSAAPVLAGFFAGLDLAVAGPTAVALSLALLVGWGPQRT